LCLINADFSSQEVTYNYWRETVTDLIINTFVSVAF